MVKINELLPCKHTQLDIPNVDHVRHIQGDADGRWKIILFLQSLQLFNQSWLQIPRCRFGHFAEERDGKPLGAKGWDKHKFAWVEVLNIFRVFF